MHAEIGFKKVAEARQEFIICRGRKLGRVKFCAINRQPILRGTIEFLPISGTRGPSAGGAITEGQYKISKGGPLPGKYKVVIRAFRGTEKMIETEAYGKRVQVEETEQCIPDRFNAKTELEVEIRSGKNSHEFSLEREKNAAENPA